MISWLKYEKDESLFWILFRVFIELKIKVYEERNGPIFSEFNEEK
jgi:hypothetical protein